MARMRLNKTEHRDIASALRSLRAAQRTAAKSGISMCVVRNGQLLSIAPDGETKVLREIPPRRVISKRLVSLKKEVPFRAKDDESKTNNSRQVTPKPVDGKPFSMSKSQLAKVLLKMAPAGDSLPTRSTTKSN